MMNQQTNSIGLLVLKDERQHGTCIQEPVTWPWETQQKVSVQLSSKLKEKPTTLLWIVSWLLLLIIYYQETLPCLSIKKGPFFLATLFGTQSSAASFLALMQFMKKVGSTLLHLYDQVFLFSAPKNRTKGEKEKLYGIFFVSDPGKNRTDFQTLIKEMTFPKCDFETCLAIISSYQGLPNGFFIGQNTSRWPKISS